MVTVSVAQIDVAWDGRCQPDEGRRAEAEAKRRGSDIIVFPELWTTVTTSAMPPTTLRNQPGYVFRTLPIWHASSPSTSPAPF